MKRFAALFIIAAAALLSMASVSPAAMGPVFNLKLHHNETNFPPGGIAELWVDVNNVGDSATTGPATVTVNLPTGLTRNSFHQNIPDAWNCPGSPGAVTITCTNPDPIPRHGINRTLVLSVNVLAISGDRLVTAKVTGGGAAQAMTQEIIHISADPAGFGVLSGSFTPDFLAADESTPVRESGAHPALFTTAFDFNTVAAPSVLTARQKLPAATVRDLRVDLPPGFLGDPTAVGECGQAQFAVNDCPPSSQVGRLDYDTTPSGGAGLQTFFPATAAVFNLSHPRGVITDLGIAIGSNSVHIKASLDPSNNYAIVTEVPNINESLPVFNQKLTIWGVPADKSHDSERCSATFNVFLGGGNTTNECSTDIAHKPFLTVPFQCGTDHQIRLHHYDSWQETGVFGPDIVQTLPGQTTECQKPRFDPNVEAIPTGEQANTPTGLDVHITIPQNKNPNALYTPPVKSAVVTLPRGMTVNPAFADGLDGCTLQQIGLGTNSPVNCPDNSRIGEVRLTTPLLPRPLEGSMYLAKQGDNAFGSTFAMYLAVHDTEERGVLIKIPGRLDLDPTTGQITTSFDELPQFPFDDFTLSFRSGQRAPLVNPPACGRQTIGIQVSSYAQPSTPVDASSTYEISEGPGGSVCPASPASRPFAPSMAAGVLSPIAGGFSSFIFRLTRTDAEQDISRVTALLPAGLTAKLAGVAICSDSAIAAISNAEGTGGLELAGPHCPANSLIGVLNTGVGAGTGPNYFGGKAYMAGPYKGAPLSFVFVVPAIAGPYDLGNVVVRAAAYINPKTAQVRVVSDPFPSIVHGVLLHVRDVRLITDRPSFTINPTDCSRMSVDASIVSDLGALASPSSPFQLGECASLGFKPSLSLRLHGGTRRGAHPALVATLSPRAGDANIESVSVAFPRSEFLDQAHIGTVCTRVQFVADQCPSRSIYGEATAITPILDYPLQANVYLRSSDNPLPDVVPDFRGPASQPIRFEAVGRVDSINGGIRNTFDLIPDAPITKVIFRLKGGKKGLLVNSSDICAHAYRATVRYTAHNGRTLTSHPKMQASCGKAKRASRKKKDMAVPK